MSRTAAIRVGVAGWDYPDWKGVLYPKPKPRGFDPVRYLADYIDLIEINSSFYRPVSKDVAQRWADRVEDLTDFRYTAKLYRRFTHECDTAWKAAEVKETRAGLLVLLAGGLGCRPWVERTEAVAEARGTDQVDVVFNNHYQAQAVVNAIQFKILLEDKKVEAPPLLQENYARELKRFTVSKAGTRYRTA